MSGFTALVSTYLDSETETAKDRKLSILSFVSFECQKSKYPGHFENPLLKRPEETALQNRLRKYAFSHQKEPKSN